MEAKGFKVNVGKTKVMAGGERLGAIEKFSAQPCGVCGKGVGKNSFKCKSCIKCLHRRCSRVKGSLQAAATVFQFNSIQTFVRAS